MKTKMAKSKTWFQNKMEEYKDDPEFWKEYTLLLQEEINFLKAQNLDLVKAFKSHKAKKEKTCKFHETRIRMNCGILDETCTDCEEKDCSLNQ